MRVKLDQRNNPGTSQLDQKWNRVRKVKAAAKRKGVRNALERAGGVVAAESSQSDSRIHAATITDDEEQNLGEAEADDFDFDDEFEMDDFDEGDAQADDVNALNDLAGDRSEDDEELEKWTVSR